MAELKRYTSDNLKPMLRQLPSWLPEATRAYLVHTEGGASIRAVARAIGSHPSTVLRQVRRVETSREDPLVDMALEQFGSSYEWGTRKMSRLSHNFWPPDEAHLMTPQMADVLDMLCVAGTVLAVVRDMENAVVVRDGPEGSTEKLSVVDRELAMTMAMQDWIIADDPENRIVRYRIAPAGRVALRDNPSSSINQDRLDKSSSPKRQRYSAHDTPLMQLSRRRDVTGDPFLSAALVQAGERIREDYELAQLDEAAPKDWTIYIGSDAKFDTISFNTPSERAHARVRDALHALGPGLADVILSCCCKLEGLENAEKSFGWAARSGKIVLRIALTHLARHYDQHHADMMIG